MHPQEKKEKRKHTAYDCLTQLHGVASCIIHIGHIKIITNNLYLWQSNLIFLQVIL